jgi:nucleoside-diphosphate-sugar epimerase
MRIIENKDGKASGKIFNVGNPANNYSIRELATMMLDLAAEYPEYAAGAKMVQLVDTSSGAYYGAGYQDVQNRVPKIDNTMEDLGWKPGYAMRDALVKIFESYRDKLGEAQQLND